MVGSMKNAAALLVPLVASAAFAPHNAVAQTTELQLDAFVHTAPEFTADGSNDGSVSGIADVTVCEEGG